MGRRDGGDALSSPPRRVSLTAFVCGAAAGSLLVVAIYLGSRGLRNFDSALIGYAVAIVFLVFGVVYRYVIWVSAPPARRYLVRGWRAFLSPRNFVRFPLLVPRQLASYLSFQTFLAQRGRARWLAHQAMFWGVVLATAITFPLVFGWITFRGVGGSPVRYRAYIWGVPTLTFDPLSWVGWVVFHGLDIAAVLVIAGSGYFIWRRLRDRGAEVSQRFGYDLVPLVGLLAISVTGLLLTFSALLLAGRGYDFLLVTHMATVVLTLVFIPFGKFFHVIQRPAQIGVAVFKRSSLARDGVVACERCGEPFEGRAFVENLEGTMDELGLRFGSWARTCPRCKRLERGAAQLRAARGQAP